MNDKTKLERALMLFAVGAWAQLSYVVLRLAVFQVWHPAIEVIEKAEALVGLGLDLLWVWAWLSLAQATDAEKHKLVRVGTFLAVVMTLLGLRGFFPGRAGTAYYGISMALWLSSLPVGWHALLGLWSQTRRRPASATTFVWVSVVLRAAVTSVYLLPLSYFDQLGFRPYLLYSGLAWVSVPASMIGLALMLWLIAQLRRQLAGDEAVTAAPTDGVLIAPPPGNDLLIGTLWLVGGVLVTFVSYAAASSGSGGGRYFVTTGAIAYGVGRIIRGFARR